MSKPISNQKKTKTNYRQNDVLYILTSEIVFFVLFYFLPVEHYADNPKISTIYVARELLNFKSG